MFGLSKFILESSPWLKTLIEILSKFILRSFTHKIHLSTIIKLGVESDLIKMPQTIESKFLQCNYYPWSIGSFISFNIWYRFNTKRPRLIQVPWERSHIAIGFFLGKIPFTSETTDRKPVCIPEHVVLSTIHVQFVLKSGPYSPDLETKLNKCGESSIGDQIPKCWCYLFMMRC